MRIIKDLGLFASGESDNSGKMSLSEKVCSPLLALAWLVIWVVKGIYMWAIRMREQVVSLVRHYLFRYPGEEMLAMEIRAASYQKNAAIAIKDNAEQDRLPMPDKLSILAVALVGTAMLFLISGIPKGAGWCAVLSLPLAFIYCINLLLESSIRRKYLKGAGSKHALRKVLIAVAIAAIVVAVALAIAFAKAEGDFSSLLESLPR